MENQPKIKLTLTRDSVCAGDDASAPHEKKISQLPFSDPKEFISVLSGFYLPTINGIGHTWDCILNGEVIGTIFTEEIISAVSEIRYSKKNSVHFKYHSSPF